LKTLENAGAEILVIACNTAHHWYEQLSRECTRPILHIADCVMQEITRRGFAKVGLLATTGTLLSHFYQSRLEPLLEQLLIPDPTDQAEIDAVIYETKAGRIDTVKAEACVTRMLAAGAEAVVLACTEMPLALADSDLGRYCIDATELLARACVAASRDEIA